ncbi:MAG: hypothetical protein JNM33_06805 [Rubrivivax sp.]|nr:hypothetical protein [Rubrivivax sp.]
MPHVMPHERPTEADLGPLLRQRCLAPALAWAIVLTLIVVGGWLEFTEARSAIRFVEAHKAATQPAAPR